MPLANGDFQNFRSVQDLLVAFYGGALITLPHDSDFTIGGAATVLDSGRKLMRVGLLLSNTGATNFYISYSQNVAVGQGALVVPGGTFKSDWYYDGDLVERPLWAISDAAGGTLHLIERLLIGA